MRKHHVRPEKPKSKTETIPAMIKRTKARIQNSRFYNSFTLLLVSVVFIGVGGYLIVNSFAAVPVAPPPTEANVWVDTNGGSCTWSSTPVSYTDSAACSTFDAAWDKASAGNTILVKAGNYSPQNINGDKASETKIIAENGTTVAGSIECHLNEYGSSSAFCADADYMTLENLTINAQNNAGVASGSKIYASNVTYRNVNLHGNYVNITINGSGFTWKGGSHGQDGIDGAQRRCDQPLGEPVWVYASDVTLDGIRFNPKKILVAPGPSCGTDNRPHIENIRLESGASNFTVKNSWFVAGSDAGSGHIFTSVAAPGLKAINNVFEPVNGTYSIQAASSACDWTFLYNTFTQDNNLGCSSSSIWVGNLGYSQGCRGSVHFKNVWQGANDGTACSEKDKTFSNLGIGAGGHLSSTSPAINAAETGTGSDYCVGALVGSRDFEGNTRPFGGACDAGASEYGSVTTPPPTPKPGDTNGDNAVNIVDLSTLLSRWNTNYPQADFNSDGTVGIVDLSILLSNYGT